MTIARASLLSLALALSVAAAPAAAVPLDDVGLMAVERDIGAARAQADRLRVLDGLGPLPYPGAELVGISDGGRLATLRALRQAGRRLERRLLLPQQKSDVVHGETAEIASAIQGGLAGLGSLIELVSRAIVDEPQRSMELERIDATLLWLDGAAAALWMLQRQDGDSGRAAADSFDHR